MRRGTGAALCAGIAVLAASFAGGCANGVPPGPTAGSLASSPAAAGSSAVPAPSPGRLAAVGIVRRTLPGCTAAMQAAPNWPAATAMTTMPRGSTPFGAAVAASGRWAFASLGNSVGVLRLSGSHPARLVRTIVMPPARAHGPPLGAAGIALSPDGKLLVVADGYSGAVVVSVPAAEQGGQAILGVLSAPGMDLGAIEVAVSADSRFAFVSMEDAAEVAVFSLAKAIADGFVSGYVGAIPTQIAPVGLAVSPDGRWLYATSEIRTEASEEGTLEVVSVPTAESAPAHAVIARAAAGCNPVRVVTSADGAVVWVTARASDALLAFSAARLRTDPQHALLADTQVGEAPVGLALARSGSLVITADSNRFGVPGARAGLAVVDVADMLAGRPAMLAYLPAGKFPRDIAAAPGGGILVLANFRSDQVEVINAARLP